MNTTLLDELIANTDWVEVDRRVAARVDAILEEHKVPRQCRCGGAQIEVRLDHETPIICGERHCQ